MLRPWQGAARARGSLSSHGSLENPAMNRATIGLRERRVPQRHPNVRIVGLDAPEELAAARLATGMPRQPFERQLLRGEIEPPQGSRGMASSLNRSALRSEDRSIQRAELWRLDRRTAIGHDGDTRVLPTPRARVEYQPHHRAPDRAHKLQVHRDVLSHPPHRHASAPNVLPRNLLPLRP